MEARETPTGREHEMFTIIDVHTGEAVTDHGEPVVFDEFDDACEAAIQMGFIPTECRIEDVA
jgi:hypothetical protein